MLEEYLGSEAGVIDRLLHGVDDQKVIARCGKIKDEVNSLVAIISQTPPELSGRA